MIYDRIKERFSGFDVLDRDGKLYVYCGSSCCYVQLDEWPLNKRLMPRKKSLRPDGSEWLGMKAKDLLSQVQCPECNKFYDRIDWPTFPSSGMPRSSCCKTTGDNSKKRYLERKIFSGNQELWLCRKCDKHKDKDSFHKSKGLLNSTCKDCHKLLYGHYIGPKKQKRIDEANKIREAKIAKGEELLTCERCGEKTKRKDWPKWKNSGTRLNKYCCFSETERRAILNKLREDGYSLCSECNETKPIFDFHINGNRPQGYCKKCAKIRGLRYGSGQKRKELINEATDHTLDGENIQRLFASFRKCPVCKEEMKSEDKTLDHIVPLSKGGAHSIYNSIIICRSCNSSKNAKDLEDWLSDLPWWKFVSYYESVRNIPELDQILKRIRRWLQRAE